MRLLFAFVLLISISATGQQLPDSIIVTYNLYVVVWFPTDNFKDGDSIYRVDRSVITRDGNSYAYKGESISRSKVKKLIAAIHDTTAADNSLAAYGIDTNWIKSHPAELLQYYSYRKEFDWNEKQKEYIFKELTDMANYRRSFREYLTIGTGYHMHNPYLSQYIVQVFTDGKLTDAITSRKYSWGIKMPWTNKSGDTIYNKVIERNLTSIIGTKQKSFKLLEGEQLLKYLVNEIVKANEGTLYVLSANTYRQEIEELKSDFEIISFDEVMARGRYIWHEPSVFRARLKNKLMYDNVNLVFLASKAGKKLYTRDSLKKDYKEYITRIQSIRFVSDYLKSHPDSKLDIYYFDNKGINDYNIENVNKNPKEWKKHDDYIKSMKRSEELGVKVSFNVDEALKTSERLYCGCNYRYERSYVEEAIFFEFKDGSGNSSIWFLLPDNKVLLYIMDGETAFNFKRSDFDSSKNYGLIYPCTLFDFEGNKIPRQ